MAGELYRRGYSVGMTIGNAKSIDLFANIDNQTVSIQVKAIINKKSSSWHIIKDQIIEDVVYVFVNLNDQGVPDYYIAIGDEIREKIKQYKGREVLDMSSLRGSDFLGRWDKLVRTQRSL